LIPTRIEPAPGSVAQFVDFIATEPERLKNGEKSSDEGGLLKQIGSDHQRPPARVNSIQSEYSV